ncbi:MAG: AAA family ATPase [Clostridiales bacterium]|nr:AAA family ATPase [Clostridiales bacterium]
MILRKTYFHQLIAFKNTEVIKVITAIRRCGKSVLLEQYGQLLKDSDQIIRMNFESVIYDDIKNLYHYIIEKLKKHIFY